MADATHAQNVSGLHAQADSLYLVNFILFLMDITVSKNSTITEIETELKTYDENFTKAGDLFKIKLRDYSKYVTVKIAEGKQESLRQPPHPPHNTRNIFLDSIKFLKAHTEDTLVMTDHEYGSLMDEIRSSHTSNTASLNALSMDSLGY